MNKKRLLKLADFLHQLPPQKFDYRFVARVGEKPMLKALRDRKGHCGTTACAVGWMPAAFPRLVRWSDHHDVFLKGDKRCTGDGNLHAAAHVFDITYYESRYLFLPGLEISGLDGTATAKQVAHHIRAFVKRGGMPKVKVSA